MPIPAPCKYLIFNHIPPTHAYTPLPTPTQQAHNQYVANLRATKTAKNPCMPDFVVQSSKDGSLFYLEVKFRADGTFYFDEGYKNYPYQNAWFVIVSPQRIQCMHYNNLIKGKGITPNSRCSLTSVKWFHIDAALLAEYEQYARELFAAYR